MAEPVNKKEAKRIATRERILETAIYLFARLGYHKTTIQDIAYHIGMTTGAVFHHYNSKPDILDEVVEILNRSFDPYIEFLEKKHSSHEELLRGITEVFLDRFNHEPSSIIGLSSLTAEFSGIRGPVITKCQAIYDRFVDAFEGALDQLKEKKTNRAEAVCFIAGLQGVALQALLRDGEMEIEDLLEGFMALTGKGFINGKD